MNKKHLLLTAILLLSSVISYSQNVTNVDAQQEGKAIVVNYDLREKSKVSLYLTYDEGRTQTIIPRDFLSGDVGKVEAGSGNRIIWAVLNQYPGGDFKAEHLSFIVKAKPCLKAFAMINVGYSFDSGAMAGITLGQIGPLGWYAKAMTTFSFPKDSKFESDKNGMIDGMLPAYSGVASAFKAYGLAGVTVRFGAPIYLLAGAGYGTREYDWETADGRWVKNAPGSYSGLAIDTGVMAKLNNIALSVGATLVNGNVDLNLGVGYVF